MNREIKFRLWNNDLKKWDKQLLIDVDNGDILYEGLSDGLRDYNYNYTLQQYTSLKDKNGKDIYEGDVVEVSKDCKTHGKVQSDGTTLWNVIEKGLRFEVDWNNLSPQFDLYPIPLDTSNIDTDMVMTWLWDSDSSPEYLEVIGNIYDNPELLKETK